MKDISSVDFAATPKFATASVASGNAAVITIPASESDFHVIDWVTWAYGNGLNAANGLLTIAIGGVTVWQINITTAGPGHIEFCKPIYGEKSQAVVITLADGTAAGRLNVRYR